MTEFAGILQQAVQDLELAKSGSQADPLPVLRKLISSCPRTPNSEDTIPVPEQVESVLKLSAQLCELLRDEKGCVPQLTALILFSILPATVGISDTTDILSSMLSAKKGDDLLTVLLKSIKTVFAKYGSNGAIAQESTSQPLDANQKPVLDSCILRLHIIIAAMQCPNSTQLMLQKKNDKIILVWLFEEVENACRSLVTRSHPCSTKALISWLTVAKRAVKLNPEATDDGSSSTATASAVVPCLNTCIIILNCCMWDGKAFSLLMDLSEAARQHCSEDLQETCRFTSANTLLLCAMWELPWKSKRKLQMLAELLPKFGAQKILSDYPDLPKGLVQCLPYNELQSVSADVYKALLKSLTEEEFNQRFSKIHMKCLQDQSTIEGFANYWLPALVKKFPGLVKKLEHKIKDNVLAEIILLHAQRKENLISLEDMLESPPYYMLLYKGLTVYDVNVRARTFNALCTGFGNCLAAVPPELMNTGLKLAHGFIMDNLSVSNQAVRNSIVRSASYLFVMVRDFLAFAMKHMGLDMPLLDTEETKPASSFMRWMYHFLVHNLEPGNSYQRHITALRLYEMALATFSVRGKNTTVPTEDIIQGLVICDCWPFESSSGARAILRCILSPADDVRSTAFKILTTYEKLSKSLPPSDDIMAEGLQLCLSQHFSTVEGGAMLYNLGVHFSKHTRSAHFTDLLAEAHRQFDILEKGLLKGALEESPVHGVLQAMLLLLQSDKKAGQMIPSSTLVSVLELMERLTEHLLTLLTSKSSTQEFAPSFEDMDWAIEAQVYHNYNVQEKSVQLSPHYQIALNCAWLNLKVSCELASYLSLLFGSNTENQHLIQRCGNLLMLVLQKCRHKGAFEAAGVALGNFVHHTSANGCKVHVHLLHRLMTTLNLKGKDAPPLSRRSAGLAVAVHRIVTSDVDEHKLLLHEVVAQLLAGLAEEESSEVESSSSQSFTDTLSARLMHVLFTLVSDSVTKYHMAKHLEDITLAAMWRLNSSNWGIRNAAMQLFGAVVTKLAAQRQSKKGDDDDIEQEYKAEPDEEWDIVGSGLLEDLQLSRPALLAHIIETLNSEANDIARASKNLKNYTSLVFHLSLIVRMTTGPPLLQTNEQKRAVKSILSACWRLLRCPEWTVRTQAATCILVFTEIFHIPALLSRAQKEMIKAPENKKHGCLILISKTEWKIKFLLKLMPNELGLYNCKENLLESKKAKIKPDGSYVCHQFIKFKDIKKGDFFRIIRELSKYPCSKHVAKMLWTANMVESVVLANKNILSPEILDKCFEAESLSYIQERVLATLYYMISSNQITEQMLEIQLILYETLDQVLIARSCNRHRLLSIIKVLVAIKRRTTEKYIRELMPDVFKLRVKESEASSKIKQWTVLCGETLWVQPLLSMLEKDIYGDDFEVYALELLGLLAVELMAGRYAEESMNLFTSLSELMQSNLQEDLPDHASIGRLLATIAPVTWNLRQFSTHHEVPLGMIGYTIIQATGELLAEHNYDAARSVWALSGKRNLQALNPTYCLRQMCRLGAEKLMSSKMLYAYLWQQLTINPEELRESAVSDSETVVSPFSQGNGGIELETFDFIASDFKYLDYFRKHLMNMDPQMAAFMPETQIDLPGSSIQEFRVNARALVETIAAFRQNAAGNIQWLPTDLQVAIRKLTLQLWIHLDILQQQGIDLTLTDLDGTSASERVFRLRRHLNTRNQLDSLDLD